METRKHVKITTKMSSIRNYQRITTRINPWATRPKGMHRATRYLLLQNRYGPSTSKCKLLNIKGNMSTSLNNIKLEATHVQKDLSLMVSPSLTWSKNFDRRVQKAIRAFFYSNIKYRPSFHGQINCIDTQDTFCLSLRIARRHGSLTKQT